MRLWMIKTDVNILTSACTGCSELELNQSVMQA